MTRLLEWFNSVLRQPPRSHVGKDVVLAFNVSKNRLLASKVKWAGTSESRRRGLIGRAALRRNEGMYIVPTQWIHMIGMRFPIDVAFVDSFGRVVHVRHRLKPYRVSRPVWGAEGALELPAGKLRETGTDVGDIIEIR